MKTGNLNIVKQILGGFWRTKTIRLQIKNINSQFIFISITIFSNFLLKYSFLTFINISKIQSKIIKINEI